MLKAVIVEDEYLAQEELKYLIKEHSNIDVVAVFDDGLQAFKYLQGHSVDVIFLDINVPSIDGMMLAKNLHNTQNAPQMVFTTAYKEHALEAFDIEAVDYLLKPLSVERVQRVLEKLEHQAAPHTHTLASKGNEPATTIPLQQQNRICIINIEDILYAVAKEKVTEVFTQDQTYIAPYTISELLQRLPEDRFFRSHRSYCVNLHKITQITPGMNSTYIINVQHSDAEIPVSRSNIKAFRTQMKL
ncbi:DNA-binding response regulator [Photobacterium jeanii]|uniref:DNA-binding response regulator n=1 Tax=Photobacterium jeanii TaxID=858640 RepID=A0A178K8I1_9GAMM|nr:LytTR family DNA-binding domain-containing protein [Photobacterium jeanii]OAN13650.1 DNA-binding response regulator [Photobacterium jeanii]PST88771.1 DNA-binding response regulator [Photobacterium jeanii]